MGAWTNSVSVKVSGQATKQTKKSNILPILALAGGALTLIYVGSKERKSR